MANGIVRELAAMREHMADLELRLSNSVRHGTVTHVDPKKQLFRMQIGKDAEGEPQLSPWIRYGQIAGALKVHAPPSVGQNMTMFAPGGDIEQAVGLPLSWNTGNTSPSQKGDENVMTFGSFRAEVRGDELVITVPRILLKCGGSTIELTDAQIAATSSAMIRLVAPQVKEN